MNIWLVTYQIGDYYDDNIYNECYKTKELAYKYAEIFEAKALDYYTEVTESKVFEE